MAKKRKMLPPRRVKIVESDYIEQSDLIKWTLLFIESNDTQTYVWPSCDLLKSLNITATQIDPQHLNKFCNDMLNKEINFVIDEEPDLPDISITEGQNDGLKNGMHEHFDAFKKVVEKDIRWKA